PVERDSPVAHTSRILALRPYTFNAQFNRSQSNEELRFSELKVRTLTASKLEESQIMNIRKFASAFAIAMLIAPIAFAQSSGNFSASGSGAACIINSTTGALSGGITVNSFTTNISTSNGNGVTLDIRPSFVTGLFTDTKISTSV